MEKDFKKLINRIEKEKRTGDIQEACAKEGASVQTYYRIKQRESIRDLSAKEERLLSRLIKILDSRRKEQQKMLSHAD